MCLYSLIIGGKPLDILRIGLEHPAITKKEETKRQKKMKEISAVSLNILPFEFLTFKDPSFAIQNIIITYTTYHGLFL
jgi:hypothetical protein